MAAPQWVIVEVKSGSEETAEKGFHQAGYRIYLPRYRKLLHRHGRPSTAQRPLFSGLLFCQDWRGWPPKSQWINGVIRLMAVSVGGPSAKLPDEDIALLMDKERAGKFDKVDSVAGTKGAPVRADIKPGDPVEFELSGERLEAVLEGISDKGRAILRMVIMGRQTLIRNVDPDSLTPIVAA